MTPSWQQRPVRVPSPLGTAQSSLPSFFLTSRRCPQASPAGGNCPELTARQTALGGKGTLQLHASPTAPTRPPESSSWGLGPPPGGRQPGDGSCPKLAGKACSLPPYSYTTRIFTLGSLVCYQTSHHQKVQSFLFCYCISAATNTALLATVQAFATHNRKAMLLVQQSTAWECSLLLACYLPTPNCAFCSDAQQLVFMQTPLHSTHP